MNRSGYSFKSVNCDLSFFAPVYCTLACFTIGLGNISRTMNRHYEMMTYSHATSDNSCWFQSVIQSFYDALRRSQTDWCSSHDMPRDVYRLPSTSSKFLMATDLWSSRLGTFQLFYQNVMCLTLRQNGTTIQSDKLTTLKFKVTQNFYAYHWPTRSSKKNIAVMRTERTWKS